VRQTLRFARPVQLAVLAIAAVIAVMLVCASASSAARPKSQAGPKSHPIHVSPQISAPQVKHGDLFGCESRPMSGSRGPRCYTPQEIQQAYGYSGLLSSGVDGSGKTIVIIDAFQNPYITTDLSIFDSTFGLPAPNFTQIAPLGLTPFDINDPNQDGWAFEIQLDVEYAHAMAPGANIVLALAPSNNDADLLATTQYVVQHHIGDVISQSFGEAEQCMDPTLLAEQHDLFAQAVSEGYTIFASSGDSGAAQFNCDGTAAIEAASTPASDPNVTGVGGTTLHANSPDGDYLSENAWTEIFGCNPPAVDPSDVNCSGGGFSSFYARPSYQGGSHATRGVPDVAYNAAVNGGVLTHCGVCNVVFGAGAADDPTIFWIFGGTSAGSPQWAGLIADADQMAGSDLGNINPTLYRMPSSPGRVTPFHDIVRGNNDVAELGGAGFDAVRGWDPVTGLGTPNAGLLLPALANG
jgi:subtilase family serine protease